MIIQVVSVWAVLFLSVQLGAKAQLKFENDAYNNVLVSFSPNVPSENGQFLLESMQDLLENASQILQEAYQVRIGEVIFFLPQAWNTATWGIALESEPVEESTTNILVDATAESAFGKYPFTLQFGGCGVPGKYITVPTTFLSTSIDYPKGTLFAREWIKYRYGVFDENGYPGDEMYPDQYFIPGNDEDVKVTECTDPPLEYVFRDSNGNNCSLTKNSGADRDNCKIYPGEISAENVKSSLMYFREDLPNMVHFCGKNHSHNNLNPNKHNILCAEKDIWSVVKDSEDFKSAGADTSEYSNVVFRYVQERKPRVSVLWENTVALYDKKIPLGFAVKRLLYDLPDDSKASLYSFTDAQNEVTKERSLSPLPAVADRSIMINSAFDDEVEEVCPTCALDMAITELIADGVNEPGFIILIIGSRATVDDATVEKLKASKLCVTVIAFKETESAIEGYESLLSASSCNSLIEIPAQEEVVPTFEKLYNAMEIAVPRPNADYMTSTVTSGMLSADSIIEIPADSTVEKFTLWLDQNIGSGSVVCTRDDGTVLSLTKEINYIAYSFPSENKAITCKLKNEKSGSTVAQVQMTTIPGEYFTEDVWTYDPTSGDQQMPVIIYVKINYAHNPVSNVRVTANVTDPDGNVIGEPLILYDNGKGDPDITRNDGIYSRYFFQFSKDGNYKVTVEIDDNSGMARVLRNGADHCCGSQVKALEQNKVPPFKKMLYSYFNAKSGQPENGYPPLRIIDLSVDEFQPPTSMVLKWTAPGGEVDSGKAKDYIIKSFQDRIDVFQNFDSNGYIMNFSQPTNEFGDIEKLEIQFEKHFEWNTTYYIAARAISDKEQHGDISNVITIYVPEDTRTTSGDETSTETSNIQDPKQGGPNKTTIGIIIGVLVAIIVLSLCVYFTIYCYARRAKANKKETTGGPKAENGVQNNSPTAAGGAIGLNSIPANVLIKHHNEVVNAKSMHKDPPIFKEENLESGGSTPSVPESNDSPHYSQIQKRRPDLPPPEQQDPSKSPKRMTVV